MTWDEEFDFVSIGGGIDGLSGALAAHDAGLSALIVEKSSQIGGIAAMSLGQLWVAGNHIASAAGIADTWQEGLDYVRWLGGGCGDEVLARKLCETAPKVVRFMEVAAGVRWSLWRYPDYHFLHGAGSKAAGRYLEVEPFAGGDLGPLLPLACKGTAWTVTNGEKLDPMVPSMSAEPAARNEMTMGAGLAAYLFKAVARAAIPFRIDTVTTKLIGDTHGVAGISVERGGEARPIRARHGVLLATSGFDRQAALVARNDARPGGATRVPPSVAGDHLRLAGSLGAQVSSLNARPQWVGPAFSEPGDVDAEGIERWQSIAHKNPHAILVNRHGRRFCDESWGPSYVAALSHVSHMRPELENLPFWAVFDQQHRDRYTVGRAGPGTPLSSVIHVAGDLSTLASAAGVDPAGLVAEVARFNGFVAAGNDAAFGRGTRPQARVNGDQAYQPHPNLGALDTPPYYAVRMEPASIGIPTMGLVANEHAQVLDWNDAPVRGLYVAGNSMAMLDLGIGYNSGLANTRAMVFAYLAARRAAGRPE